MSSTDLKSNTLNNPMRSRALKTVSIVPTTIAQTKAAICPAKFNKKNY
jgi:hypothetical protein